MHPVDREGFHHPFTSRCQIHFITPATIRSIDAPTIAVAAAAIISPRLTGLPPSGKLTGSCLTASSDPSALPCRLPASHRTNRGHRAMCIVRQSYSHLRRPLKRTAAQRRLPEYDQSATSLLLLPAAPPAHHAPAMLLHRGRDGLANPSHPCPAPRCLPAAGADLPRTKPACRHRQQHSECI